MSRTQQDPEDVLARLEAATARAREATREANGVSKDLIGAMKTARALFHDLGEAAMEKEVKVAVKELREHIERGKNETTRLVLRELRTMQELVASKNKEEEKRRRRAVPTMAEQLGAMMTPNELRELMPDELKDVISTLTLPQTLLLMAKIEGEVGS